MVNPKCEGLAKEKESPEHPALLITWGRHGEFSYNDSHVYTSWQIAEQVICRTAHLGQLKDGNVSHQQDASVILVLINRGQILQSHGAS